MNKERFIKELEKIGIIITEKQLTDLEKYYNLLIEENKKYNLTAITEKEEVYLKHFYDSLTVYKSIKIDNQYICDVGTGAGFPGLVLKIVFPNIKLDLIDATLKKCNFLKMVTEKLNLKEVNIINDRIENYSKKNREKYDIVTSRAVAPLKHLLEYSIPLLKVNGVFVALKADIDRELINIDNYYKKLFLTNETIIRFKLPIENSNRCIYTIEKQKKTPQLYPRYSQIKNKDI